MGIEFFGATHQNMSDIGKRRNADCAYKTKRLWPKQVIQNQEGHSHTAVQPGSSFCSIWEEAVKSPFSPQSRTDAIILDNLTYLYHLGKQNNGMDGVKWWKVIDLGLQNRYYRTGVGKETD